MLPWPRQAVAKAKAEIRSNPRQFFAIGTGKLPLLVFCNPKSVSS